MDTNLRKRKEKGGAEKAREEKVKLLAGNANKCRKLTDLFGSSAATTTSTIITSSLEQVHDEDENEEGAIYSQPPAFMRDRELSWWKNQLNWHMQVQGKSKRW